MTEDNRSTGISVTGSEIEEVKKLESAERKRILPHMVYSIALPYLDGAKTQTTRYREAAAKLEENPVVAVQVCLHEVSCLFEDLATVTKYTEMCGQTNELHSLWLDVRNHIRHDIREELDNESDARKNARAKRLGLNPKMQISISFKPEEIKVGGTQIAIRTIEEYLNWAGDTIGGVLHEAREKGWIK